MDKNFDQSANRWWRGATLYQIYPRSFQDSNGDGIGDLAGITSRLDYVASLGVDGIWMSPFFTSPMADFGYDVADYCAVDPIFGTLEDFDVLLARAHALGLKVVIDQVYAHTSDQHSWFSESRSNRDNPKHDWYVWADAKPDGSPPNNWTSVFGGPGWTWDARRGQYYLHNFLKEQPQLNLHNRTVQDSLLDVARFWLDRGVDGFRLDAINFAFHDQQLRDNPALPVNGRTITRPFDFQDHVHNQNRPEVPSFLSRIRQLTDSYPDRFTLAEVAGAEVEREMKTYTANENHLNSAYSFRFLAAEAISPQFIAQILANWPGSPGESWPTWAFSNHDAKRWISRWGPAGHEDDFARMILTLFFCLRGQLVLYQGEELGLTQVDIPFGQLRDPEAIANWPFTLSRDGARTPMVWTAQAPDYGFTDVSPWLPFGPDHSSRAIAAQDGDPASLLETTRHLIRLRSNSPALRHGELANLQHDGKQLSFDRIGPGQSLRCRFSFGDFGVLRGANSRVLFSTAILGQGPKAYAAEILHF